MFIQALLIILGFNQCVESDDGLNGKSLHGDDPDDVDALDGSSPNGFYDGALYRDHDPGSLQNVSDHAQHDGVFDRV